MPEQNQKAEPYIILRNYPKAIFFYPLFITTIVLWVIQLIMGTPEHILGAIWMIVFFTNIFVVAFNFSSTKFFVMILIIVIAGLIFAFLVIPRLSSIALPPIPQLDISMSTYFYLIMAFVLGFILLFIFITAHFDYWKIERNEIFHRTGIFVKEDRYSVKQLRIKKRIPDIFEYILLRSGSITLYVQNEDFHLDTGIQFP
ncbi:MAG: hypothetical protein P8Y97_05130 [Candidatus Lokiarchaeota archaeon]